MIAQNLTWDEQVAKWIAEDAVAEEYQRFFRCVGVARGAGAS